MYKSIKEGVAAFKKGYIQLAAESRWYDQKPGDGLKEANCDGRMRAMSALYDFERTMTTALGLTDDDLKKLKAQCEKTVAAKTNQKLKATEKARRERQSYRFA